jgi:hypothetical protein
MRTQYLQKRVEALEATAPKPDGRGKILSQCDDDELDRYGEIARRYEDHIELTEEDMRFLAELEAKYA